MADLTIKRGDYGFYLNFTITDSDDVAYVLTDYTLKLKVWKKNTPGLIVNGACDIVVAGSGTCKYAVVSGDFRERGVFDAEIELTKAAERSATETFEIEVKESH